MKKLPIPENLMRSFNKIGFKLKKHSPEILMVAGAVGTVVSTVMACKATTKVSGIIEEAKEEIGKVHEIVEDERYADKYTEADSRKDLTIIYAQTGVKLVKLYAPSVVLGALSLGSMLASNNILRKRNVAIAAAYATVDKSFKDYRKRVVERFGEEIDKQLKYGVKAEEIEKTVIDENGEEKTVTETVETIEEPSEYARFFDEYSKEWQKDPEYNLMFLRSQERYANDMLKAKGYLFLNQVYESLGLEPTKAGQIIGWVYDPNDSTCQNHVDFGIYDYSERKRAFVNGHERSILLDFNVDGNIWDLMQ